MPSGSRVEAAQSFDCTSRKQLGAGWRMSSGLLRTEVRACVLRTVNSIPGSTGRPQRQSSLESLRTENYQNRSKGTTVPL